MSERAAPAVEVVNVSVPSRLPDAVRAARLRLPERGETDVFAFDVAGMVITRGGDAQSIELLCGGMLVREIPVNLERPGLKTDFPDQPDTLACGFRALVGVLLLPSEFELEVVVVRDDGARFSIGSIVGRRACPSPSVEPALRPLMLTSLGRAGTVWAMGMLAAHPSIVVHQQFRYEGWPARYWAHVFKVLAGPADHVRSPTSHGFDHVPWHVGPNPFYFSPGPVHGELREWLGREHVDRLASFCLQSIEDWYAVAARQQGKAPVYFAEKNLLRTPLQDSGVSDLYPATSEIFLVRDFRDMACSMLSFLGDSWREKNYDSDRALREIIAPWVGYLVSGWRARAEQAHLVRYEDLVFAPEETVSSVFDYLKIDSSERTVEEVLRAASDGAGFTAHGTSASLENTVGRWSRAEDAAFRDMLNEVLQDALVEFGYAEAPATRA